MKPGDQVRVGVTDELVLVQELQPLSSIAKSDEASQTMTEEEKMESIDALMALCGGWVQMSHQFLGEYPHSPLWNTYKKLRGPISTKNNPLYNRRWRLAFYDTIHNENYTAV